MAYKRPNNEVNIGLLDEHPFYMQNGGGILSEEYYRITVKKGLIYGKEGELKLCRWECRCREFICGCFILQASYSVVII